MENTKTFADVLTEMLPKVKEVFSDRPFVNAFISTLGGANNASILLTVSIDKPEDWAHSIMENSKYYRFHIERNSKGIEIECFTRGSGTNKIRKATVPMEKVIEKLTKINSQL